MLAMNTLERGYVRGVWIVAGLAVVFTSGRWKNDMWMLVLVMRL